HGLRLPLPRVDTDHQLPDLPHHRSPRHMVKHLPIAILLAGCGSFADPDVVVDFRVLALGASVPEQIVDVDINNPQPSPDLLAQLVPSEVCVLLSDQNFDRRLRWSMTLCNLNSDERCSGDARTVIGSGVWNDPDLSPTPPKLCATVQPDGNLLGVLLA